MFCLLTAFCNGDLPDVDQVKATMSHPSNCALDHEGLLVRAENCHGIDSEFLM